ncbi:MAG: hypothetical protein [Olavius algarvensis Gamma 1 endosymbiont]|nr:MAG: hypothetical protein [Olavius algarvensis Gamma 1 endosymbiont]
MTAKMPVQPSNNAGLYNADIIAWAEEQARLLRTGRLSE